MERQNPDGSCGAFPLTFPKQATAKASDPCDRRPDETASAHARFLLFQSLPPYSRSLSAVARVCGVTRQSIQQQATRHEWELRVGPPNILGAISALSFGGKHPLLELLEEREKAGSSGLAVKATQAQPWPTTARSGTAERMRVEVIT